MALGCQAYAPGGRASRISRRRSPKRGIERGRADGLNRDHPEFEGRRQFPAAWGIARAMVLGSDPGREPDDRAIAGYLARSADLLHLCNLHTFPQTIDSILAYRDRLQAEQAGAAPALGDVEGEAVVAELSTESPSDNLAERRV